MPFYMLTEYYVCDYLSKLCFQSYAGCNLFVLLKSCLYSSAWGLDSDMPLCMSCIIRITWWYAYTLIMYTLCKIYLTTNRCLKSLPGWIYNMDNQLHPTLTIVAIIHSWPDLRWYLPKSDQECSHILTAAGATFTVGRIAVWDTGPCILYINGDKSGRCQQYTSKATTSVPYISFQTYTWNIFDTPSAHFRPLLVS